MKLCRKYLHYLLLFCAFTAPFSTYAKKKEDVVDQPVMVDSTSGSKSLSSRRHGYSGFERMRNMFGGHMCTTPESTYLAEAPPAIVVHGRLSSLTAVLVGYGANEVAGTFRSNKGYVYGLGNSVSFFPKFAHRVSFTYDYMPPKQPRWETEEFCALIFSPALNLGPSIISTIGNNANSRQRFLGSTENIVRLLISESAGTRSKLVTQCCFLMHKQP
ncbi:signal peptide containing protein, putative [Babesia ovata]|uniref:Signal peptide containing protein, putative n=1 Tax=Babesia ovata TaxID=189622 RepID=A0A2H6KEB1_9APIC|nr:signal peptide containing protein, putative [Babesia ovata]GBE61332.1 signal peptide containing protein, putative [Babesia ovata]